MNGRTGDSTDWGGAYGDMMPTSSTPLFGVRVVVSLDEQGQKQYVVAYDNTDEINGFELAGFLHQMAHEVTGTFMNRIERK